MSPLSTAPLTFYPAYCFCASPTFNTWARVTATEVHSLQQHKGFEGQKIYFHLNHPIRWIRLVGVIVAFDAYPTRWILTIDDSSGETLELMCPRAAGNPTNTATVAVDENNGAKVPPDNLRADRDNHTVGTTATGLSLNLADVDIGSIVKVKGGITEFRGVKQMALEKLSILRTTNDEAAAWSERSHFHATILSHPWLVSREEQNRLLEEAKGSRCRDDDRLRRRQERARKLKANGEVSSMSRVEGRIQAQTATDVAAEAGRNGGSRKEKQQRSVGDKENRAQAQRPGGNGVWAHEEAQMRRDAAARRKHRRAKGAQRAAHGVAIATDVRR
ncbi:MAG: hypothetical protein FRX48_01631 [Lasallia pustulata]|uniref:CST complex subunit Stn1 N-terminal domain-containing protein n=1 Tax=Lasallia pustulata TaxID=136370 RepID=A0A5M8PYP8_9LECA|nr:MAG: hypothetical protein FRX48_01631 [Lasallia pustulata]